MIQETARVARLWNVLRDAPSALLSTRDGWKLKRGKNFGERARMRKHEIGCGGDVVDRRVRQMRRRLGAVADQRDNIAVLRVDRRVAGGRPLDLDLWPGNGLCTPP